MRSKLGPIAATAIVAVIGVGAGIGVSAAHNSGEESATEPTSTAEGDVSARMVECPSTLDTSSGQTCTAIEGWSPTTNPADVERAVCAARADEPEYVATFCDPQRIAEIDESWQEVQSHDSPPSEQEVSR